MEIKIIDPNSGEVVPRGQAGELCTRGYSVMLGYWNYPEATREAIDAGRWMHTGDLATMDDEGYVNIVGRKGHDHSRWREYLSTQIEEFLYTHPDVSDVQVIGVPSERYGEEVEVRRRVPNDRDWQSPEVSYARDGSIGAGPGGSRRRRHRVSSAGRSGSRT